MIHLLAYGSLLNKSELRKQGMDPKNATPVIVSGFRRSFSQEPSWRRLPNRARAVLRAEPDEAAWFNALMIPCAEDFDLSSLDQRERGYQRVRVNRSRIRPFDHSDLPSGDFTPFLYCGKAQKRNDSLLPNESYLRLCVAGALQWGTDFRNTFLSSTFIAERTAGEYLEGLTDGSIDTLSD